MEIVPGVHAIQGLGVGRAYLYEEADKLSLIDTGLPNSAGRIFDEIERAGRKPADVRQVIITHHHGDHAGSLGQVVERTEAQVLVHALDAPVVRGEREPPGPSATGLLGLIVPLLTGGVKPPPPANVDRELADGDEIDLDGGATVLHVPGHTMGSVAIYVPGKRLLFAGDAATNSLGLGPPAGPFGLFNEDKEKAAESFRRLAAIDFDVACFGHGKPLDRDASRLFRRAADQLGY